MWRSTYFMIHIKWDEWKYLVSRSQKFGFGVSFNEMLLVTLIKYFLHWSNKKCNIFSAAGSIENFAFCPSRYIDIILYADEGSVLDPPPALPVSTLYVLSEMHSRAGKKVASGKPCLRLCLTWYLENYMLCKCEKMIFHIYITSLSQASY